jgi:hypothetical protein
MDSVTNVTTVVIVVLLAVGLYYLYKYVYGGSGVTTITVVNGVKNAVRKESAPIVVGSDTLPPLYEGGEYSVSFWLYINDFKYRRDMHKHVLSLGGTATSGFDTLRVYLGAYKNTLSVRVSSRSPGTSGPTATGAGGGSGPVTDYLPLANYNAEFSTIPQGLDQGYFPSCDLTAVDLQRWVNITIILNGRTTDVYMDGKLARSCVLPSFYKVDPAGYKMTVLDKGGFGGYISNVRAYGYTLNPDQVYRNYMAGPGPQYTFTEWVTSLFDPKAAGTMDYPKMN